MKLKNIKIKTVFNAVLITLTVALMCVEVQLVFKGGFERVFASDPAPVADAPAVPDAAAGQPAAADSPPTTMSKDITGEEQLQCATIMRPYMEDKRKEFADFINEHFKSKAPTSELIPVAIERLRQYRDEIRARLNEFGPHDGRNLEVLASESGACRDVVNENYKISKDLLQNHIQENSYAKKSTRLLDKYKEINSQLDKMNFDVAQMYANFSIFSQKLPCYARSCQ